MISGQKLEARDPSRQDQRDEPRRFTHLYLIALSVVAAFTIAGQVLVQRSINSQHSGSHAVNRAGAQRMLSQRIALKIVNYDETQAEGRAPIRVIESLRDRWVATHAELVARLGEIAFDRSDRDSLKGLFDELRQPMERISGLVDTLANRGSLTPAERNAVLTDQEIFLPLMDAVVLGFEQSVRARLAFLQNLELGLMTLTLVVLGLEAALVFRPAVRRLRSSLEQLEQQRRQTATRLESLRHLAGGIAHNFNNILTGIQGHAELQRLDAEASRQNTEYIDAQLAGCKRAADIVEQLLKYSGYGRFDREPTAVGSWLAGLAVSIVPSGSPTKVEVKVLEDATVAMDRSALAQAVDGIVANAIEAMAGRGGSVVVQLHQVAFGEPMVMSGPYRTALPPGLYACIRVIDDGEGISAGEIDRIFDPYHTRKQFGRGLGLAAILGVAHGHGGGIEVKSKPGCGTAVSLYLPMMATGTETYVTSGVRV